MPNENADRQRGRPKTFDQDRFLELAVQEYWREGPDSVSLNELCRRAGVSKPGVYREFGSEDGLMARALARYAVQILAPVLEHTKADVPFLEAFEHILARITFSDEQTPPGCLFTRLRSSPGRLGSKTAAMVGALRQRSMLAYSEWIERGKARGDLDRGVPTTIAADFIDGQFNHLFTQMAAGDAPESLRAQARIAFKGLLAD